MLNRSLKLAFPYADLFAEKHKSLYPHSNTILQDLVSASSPVLGDDLPSFVNKEADNSLGHTAEELYINAVDTVVNGDTVDGIPTDWANRLDGYVADISKLVSQHLSYARNVVQPAVKEMADEIIRLKELYSNKSPSSGFDIQVLSIADVLRDDSFLDMIKNYRGHNPIRPKNTVVTIKGMTPEELKSFISTGMKRVDESISEWLLTEDSDLLSRIWTGFFSNEGATARPLSFDLIEAANPITRANYALAYYLVANAFMNKPEEGLEGTRHSLSEAKALISDHVNYAGTLLAQTLNQVAAHERTGVLVVAANKRHKTIAVNRKLYEEWLNDPEDNDVLLGMLVSNDSHYTIAKLNENAKRYRTEWHNYITVFQAHERNRVKNDLSSGILDSFVRSLSNKDEVEAEYAQQHSDLNDRLYKEAQKVIEDLCDKLIDDPYETALCLVAGVRFHFTPAEQILRDIQKAYDINPEVEVREAALLATINYVSDYLAFQIGVK